MLKTINDSKPLFYFCQHAAECPVINFFEAIHDKVLQGHIIKIVNVTEEANCQVHCVLTESCVSYNLGPKTNSNQHICELSKFDHIRFPDDLKVKEGFTYGAVKASRSEAPFCFIFAVLVIKPVFTSDATQAQKPSQEFLFHRKNGVDEK